LVSLCIAQHGPDTRITCVPHWWNCRLFLFVIFPQVLNEVCFPLSRHPDFPYINKTSLNRDFKLGPVNRKFLPSGRLQRECTKQLWSEQWFAISHAATIVFDNAARWHILI